MPAARPAQGVRCGYMPPEKGRVYSPLPAPRLDSATSAVMSQELGSKVRALYNKMDLDSNGKLTRSEANKFFRKFPEISTKAMFDEVDEDRDGLITLNEFERFWGQVLCNGYLEHELLSELDDLLEGHAWVNFTDDRDVALSPRSSMLLRR